jgi:hypothetical protein
MKEALGSLLASFLLIVLAGCSGEISKADIMSASTTLKEQQLAVWEFEKQLQCKYFSPCFYSIVDGALEKSPASAVKNCEQAAAGLQKLAVPSGLPKKVVTVLEEARAILQRNAEWSLKTARFAVGETRTSAGTVPANAQTCDAYSRIDKVNNAYGLKKLMKGYYINCQVLDAGPAPDFPQWEQLK